MTIAEALARIDEIKASTVSDDEKIRWLSELDGRIKAEIIDTHEGDSLGDFHGYGTDVDRNTPLIVGYPYDDIYIKWLEAKIDYENGETARYNNAIVLFNAAYSEYWRYYNRTHMPKGNKIKYWR